MGAVVDVGFEIPPVFPGVDEELDAAFFHAVLLVVIEFERAHAVGENVDFDAGVCALAECFDELVADFPGGPDVGFERHAFLRLADGVEHDGEEAFAVDERGDFVAPGKFRAEQRAERIGKNRIARTVGNLYGFTENFGGSEPEITPECGHDARGDDEPVATRAHACGRGFVRFGNSSGRAAAAKSGDEGEHGSEGVEM